MCDLTKCATTRRCHRFCLCLKRLDAGDEARRSPLADCAFNDTTDASSTCDTFRLLGNKAFSMAPATDNAARRRTSRPDRDTSLAAKSAASTSRIALRRAAPEELPTTAVNAARRRPRHGACRHQPLPPVHHQLMTLTRPT